MATVRLPTRRVVTPSGAVDYAQSSKVGAVLFFFGLVVAIDLLRRGWPGNPAALDRQRLVTYFGAAFVFVVLANFAPGLAQALLLAVVVLMALNAAPQIGALFQKLAGGLGVPATPTHGGVVQ